VPEWLSTTRVGPLTSSPDQSPPPLQDTTRWRVGGTDEGVSLYFAGRGPYPLERYTTWDPQTGILDLWYPLSLFNPYQVQIMHTQILLP
jgi:hypothetical protein